jgi:hypothetical protein
MAQQRIEGTMPATVELTRVLGRVLEDIEIGWKLPDGARLGSGTDPDDVPPGTPVVWYVTGTVHEHVRLVYGRTVYFASEPTDRDHAAHVVEQLARAVRHFGGRVEVRRAGS